MMSEREQAILAGVVLGVIFLLTVLTTLVYFQCRKRKHHKKREHKKPHTISTHVSPTHSQPSSLGNYINGSLPKVSSTGLWMDTPSVYAVTPPHNYYYGRPHGYSMRSVDYHYHISRATSETRIPAIGLPPRPYYGSQNNVFLMPMNQRIYHSQPLAPVYELPPSRGMEIYDYPFSGEIGGMRSKMLETRHTPEFYNNTSEFMLKARVERARSDAENKRPSKPLQKKEQSKQNKTSSQDITKKSAPNDSKNLQPSGVSENVKLLTSTKAAAGVSKTTYENVHSGQFNNAFSSEPILTNGTAISFKNHALPVTQLPLPKNNAISADVLSSQHINSSATDSMKLLANNKTDDQKTQPSFVPLIPDKIANKTESDQDFNIQHYTYEGSIYAVSRRSTSDNDYDNPLINRMKKMVIERTRHSNISAPGNEWNDSYNGAMSNNNITSAAERHSTALQSSNNKDILDGLYLPDILNVEEEESHSNPPHVLTRHESSNRSLTIHESIKEVTHSSSPVADHGRGVLTSRGDADADGGTDDLNKAGKQITTSAFQFLDNYLSDDEGGESLIDSPPVSPGGQRVGEVY